MFYPTISCSEARVMIRQGAQLVDVRLPHEYLHCALPGAVNIPLPAIQQAIKQLDKNTPVIVYCGSGQRSGTAKRILEAFGFVLVHNLGSHAFYNDCNQKQQQRRHAHEITSTV